ncbi:MAG: hypothetical protein ACK5IP_20875 [Paracoccus sp. (in: a-proteobacteria)]
MSLFEIVRTFGVAGAVGVLIGIALITWVRPLTLNGSLLLFVLSISACIVVAATIRAIAAWRTKRDPSKPE